jgi:hypothetical protein
MIAEKIIFHYCIKTGQIKNLPFLKAKDMKIIGKAVVEFQKVTLNIPTLQQIREIPVIKEKISLSYLDTLYDCNLEQYDNAWLESEFEDWKLSTIYDSKITEMISEFQLNREKPKEFGKIFKKAVDDINFLTNKSKEKNALFSVKTANDWIKQSEETPTPRKLFSGLWFEHEVCFLFSSTNIGKSTLAVQILDSLSKGSSIEGFVNETEAHKTLYLDFELSAKQFHMRTFEMDADILVSHNFSNNFLRAEMLLGDYKKAGFASYEMYFESELSRIIEETGCKTLCIDNISWLLDEGEKSQKAIQIMKHIMEIRKKFNLSILVIAHTPKKDMTKSITINDMAGSAALTNFVRSAFTIGKASGDETLRYIKQLKATSEEKTMESDNVAVCRLSKKNGLLQFNFIEHGDEYQLLNVENRDQQLSDRDSKIIELHKNGLTGYAITKQTGIPKQTVYRVLESINKPKEKKMENHNYFELTDNEKQEMTDSVLKPNINFIKK